MGRTFFPRWTAALVASLLLLVRPATAEETFPFAAATRAGDLIFLSGQIGIAPGSTRPVTGGLTAEARQAMDNIGATLATHGLGYDDLVKCTAMITDMAQWEAFNRVYASYFRNGVYPARSALGVSALALGAQVEIECIARLPARPVAINPGTPLGPYAQAAVVNGTIHVSGIIAFEGATGRFAPPDIGAQMSRIFANLDSILAASGASKGDVVRTTLYLRDAGDLPAANAAYAAYFAGPNKPARTTVPGIDWGRPDILAEIDAIAVVPAGKAGQ